MPNSKRQNAAAIIAALLILLLLYTAINKLADRQQFAAVMNKSPLLKNINVLLSWAIPMIEIIICILLFLPATREPGLLCSAILMFAFTVYIAYMLATSSNLPCACGGALKSLSWKEHLIFNIGVTGIAMVGWQLEKRNNFLLINRPS